MPDFTAELMTATVKISAVTRAAAQTVWDVLSSEKAQQFYKAVIVAIIVIIVIAAMGVWEALKTIAFPAVKIAYAWSCDRAIQGWASFRAWLVQVQKEADGFVAIVMEGAIGL